MNTHRTIQPDADDVVATYLGVCGTVVVGLILVYGYWLLFLSLHGPYHFKMIDDAGGMTYESRDTAQQFAEWHVEALQRAHPTWQIACLDCTPWQQLLSMGELFGQSMISGK